MPRSTIIVIKGNPTQSKLIVTVISLSLQSSFTSLVLSHSHAFVSLFPLSVISLSIVLYYDLSSTRTHGLAESSVTERNIILVLAQLSSIVAR